MSKPGRFGRRLSNQTENIERLQHGLILNGQSLIIRILLLRPRKIAAGARLRPCTGLFTLSSGAISALQQSSKSTSITFP